MSNVGCGRRSGIDHSALMEKVTVKVKGRRKRTRKRIVFDAEGNILRNDDDDEKVDWSMLSMHDNGDGDAEYKAK